MILCNQIEKPRTISNAVVLRGTLQDAQESVAMREMLRTVIIGNAEAHESCLLEEKLDSVLKAVADNKIQAYFVMLTDGGLPRFGGGTIRFPSVMTEWNGCSFDHYPAVYREDIFIMPELSAEYRKHNISTQCPKGKGLGTRLTQEDIRLAVCGTPEDRPFGSVAYGLLEECTPNNPRAVHLLERLGALCGSYKDSGVLHFTDKLLPFALRFYPCVELEFLSKAEESDDICPNIFAVSWKSDDKQQQIVATFTEAFSTFNGEAIVRVQLKSNGNLPKKDVLRDILFAIIREGEKEIANRDWISIDEDSPVPFMYFHILREPEILQAMKALGANRRILGDNIMLPLSLCFKDIPDGSIDYFVPDAEPFECSPSHKFFQDYYDVPEMEQRRYATL